ncbi:MAG: iron-siderophore ABC transporter substrate-binding protein [Symploca sp. SIO2B6]|nr:iron-siderophore ABC transporter substrate-binding protein [Symploca sp. SIO2B6]
MLLISACSSNSPSLLVGKNDITSSSEELSSRSSCLVVKHYFGKTEICGQPQRLVALDPHALDLMLSLDIQPVGYAETRYLAEKNFGQPIRQIKYFSDRLTVNPINIGTRQSPSLETIIKLKPDLIVGQLRDPSLYANLSKIAPTLFPLKNFNDYHWQEKLITLGQITNLSQNAQRIVTQHNQKIAQVKVKLNRITRNSKVLLLGMSAPESIKIVTDKHFAGALLENIGFKLVIPQQPEPNLTLINISLEGLPQLDADTIIVMANSYSSVAQVKREWALDPILRSLNASKTGHVYFVDGQLWGRIRGPLATELIIDQVGKIFLDIQRPLPTRVEAGDCKTNCDLNR